MLAGKQGGTFNKDTIASNRIIYFQVIFPAGNEIFLAMSGSRMHRTGSRFSRYMLTENNRHLPIVKGVLQCYSFQGLTTDGS